MTLVLERSTHDADLLAGLEFRPRWKIDQAARLTRPDRRNDPVRDGNRCHTVHDEPRDAWRFLRRAPLELDLDEQIAGEKQRAPDHNSTTHDTALA
jgi:hypothetical protein